MNDVGYSRVLIVTRNLPPLWGGMERLNWHLADELARHLVVRVVGPTGAAEHAPRSVQMYEVPLKPLPNFLFRAQWKALRLARAWRPEFVLAGSGLTAPLVWLAARACGAKAVAYVHGLDVGTRHPVYRHLWLPFLRRMDRVIANSRATAELAKRAGIDPMRLGIVHPGVSLPQDSMDPGIAAHFRAKYGLGSRPLLLSVGRLTRRKGLRAFVTEALPSVVACHPDILLLIVGDAPTFSLHADAQTPQSIQTAADSAGVGRHVKFLGKLFGTDLLAAYQAADVHVFPVQQIPDDPEGFGMVAIEAAAHGLPTVAYATGGVIDAVADGKSGRLVPPGDYNALAQTIIETLLVREAMRQSCVAFAQDFAWPRFGEALIKHLDAVKRVQRPNAE
jgi:phosphatidylinositol alpha-1,6-mannosyltransferase